MLGQEAVAEESNEITAIPALVERLAVNDGLKDAVVSIDAIATNARVATAIRDAGAHYLLAVKDNQPTLRAEIESFFASALWPPRWKASPMSTKDTAALSKEPSRWLARSTGSTAVVASPGELRLPQIATLVRVAARAELKDRSRFETRYYICSATLSAARAAEAVRSRWAIENSLHWVLDVTFGEDQARLRKGTRRAINMAVVRHFAINLVRAAVDKKSIKLRRKRAGWGAQYLAHARSRACLPLTRIRDPGHRRAACP